MSDEHWNTPVCAYCGCKSLSVLEGDVNEVDEEVIQAYISCDLCGEEGTPVTAYIYEYNKDMEALAEAAYNQGIAPEHFYKEED